jgi:hypothetical protein
MHQKSAVHFMRAIACAAAMLVAAPAMANDRHDDRDRGRGGSHHHGHGHDADDLAAELKALKERVRRLEGHLTRDEVVGGYVLRTLQVALITNTGQPTVGRLEHLSFTASLQLDANGTFSFSGTETGFNAIWQVPTLRERVVRPDSGSGTWAYADGVISLTFDGGEVVPFGGAVGGRLFQRVESNPADGTVTYVTLTRRAQ